MDSITHPGELKIIEKTVKSLATKFSKALVLYPIENRNYFSLSPVFSAVKERAHSQRLSRLLYKKSLTLGKDLNYFKNVNQLNQIIKMEKKLQGQIAIITGASSGIGAGVAKAMAAAGASVVVNYPVPATKDSADKVLQEIIAGGGNGITYGCDVSKEDEVIKMFADVIAKFGTVDILVNNAGLQRDAKFTEMTLEQWNFVLAVNLTGQFLCAREAIKEFLRRGIDEKKSKAAGKIICMSSVHEVIPWAGHANYAASKGGHYDDDENNRTGICAKENPYQFYCTGRYCNSHQP